MVPVVIATRNRHKFRELTALLALPGLHWLSLDDVPGAPSVKETGRTFDANAIRKACAIAKATGMLALADDSGLEVDALDGAPGIRSARFAGRHGDHRANNDKLLRLLHGFPLTGRGARYRCSLALARPGVGKRRSGVGPSRLIALARGTWRGRIALQPKGRGGFGYDPIFLVPRFGKTVGELPVAVKQRLSHRAIAARRMRHALRRVAAPSATGRRPASFAGGPRGRGRAA